MTLLPLTPFYPFIRPHCGRIFLVRPVEYGMELIRPGVEQIDGCPVLTRSQVHVVPAGTAATLEYTFRDAAGVPRQLYGHDESESESESGSEPGSDYRVVVRFKELMTPHTQPRSLFTEVCGSVSDADGVVTAPLPATIAKSPGVYTAAWAYMREDNPVYVATGLVFVEPSLFAAVTGSPGDLTSGPPSIQDIRMSLMDSSRAENQLLNSLEYSDSQLAQCIARPIQQFNELPPPLHYDFCTRDFPWREHWQRAIVGHLLRMSAHNYRRNRLATSAGGITVDDKNKEREYMAAAELLLREWEGFAAAKKVELNIAGGFGSLGSSYSAWGWR